MNYTAAEIVVISTTIITAISVGIVNVIVALKANKKMDQNLERSATIENHVNGDRTRFLTEIEDHKKEIERLKTVINEKEKAAALLAQSVASAVIMDKTNKT